MRSPQCKPMMISPCYHGDSVHNALRLCNISYGLFWKFQTCTCMFPCTAEFLLSIRVTRSLQLSASIMLLVWLRGQKQPQCLFFKQTFSLALLLFAWAGGIIGLDNLGPAVYPLFPSPNNALCVIRKKQNCVCVRESLCFCDIICCSSLSRENKKNKYSRLQKPTHRNQFTGWKVTPDISNSYNQSIFSANTDATPERLLMSTRWNFNRDVEIGSAQGGVNCNVEHT